MREGESASDTEIDSMYVIMSGELTVHVGGRDAQHIVAVMRKGEIVGERALLLQQDRAATVKAKTTVCFVLFLASVPCVCLACAGRFCPPYTARLIR